MASAESSHRLETDAFQKPGFTSDAFDRETSPKDGWLAGTSKNFVRKLLVSFDRLRKRRRLFVGVLDLLAHEAPVSPDGH